MPLKIAFIAWDAEKADTYLRRFAIDNADQVKRYELGWGRIFLKDGTEIVSVNNPTRRQGQYFDQYIIADDSRMKVMRLHGAVLNELECRCQTSIVPEEYRRQFYNIDEEG